MIYNKGEFFLINNPKGSKRNKIIAEIKEIYRDKTTKVKVYIFPESTKSGRQSYMGLNEVLCTSNEINYKFNGKDESKVYLIPYDKFLLLKLNSQPILKDIYYYRQSYNFDNGKLSPEKLPITCYCKQIFNPDIPFKKCKCGSYFHIDCFLKANTNECWALNCQYNCSKFLDASQQIQKIMNQTNKINNNENENNSYESSNNNISSFYKHENKKELLNQKTKRKTESNSSDNYFHEDLNLSKRTTSFDSFKSLTIKKESSSNLNISKNEKSFIIIGDTTKNKEIINRDKGQSIIYKVLTEGQKLIKDNPNLKEQYAQNSNKNEITNLYLNNFSKKIEENLYSLYKSNSSSYFNFLQEFNKIKTSSKDLLTKIILGFYTPEEISNFKGNDFLSEEKRKERELKKKEELEKIKIKEETNNIKLTMIKGNLLSEKENFKESENDNNISQNIILNIKDIKDEKFFLARKQYPKLKEYEIRNLIDLDKPSIDNIQKRLESILKKNLDSDSIDRFLEIRKNMIYKKAKTLVKRDKDINKDENTNESKIKEYIKKISFDDLEIKV